MKKVFKKVLLFTSIFMITFIFVACGSKKNKDVNETTKEKINEIEKVYIKKGQNIGKNKSEYLEMDFGELKSFKKLYDGLFLIFKPKSDIYIHNISFSVAGNDSETISYELGSYSSLTSYYSDVLYDDTYETIKLNQENNIIVEKQYISTQYFYFSLSLYCEYSNIIIDYSKEEYKTNEAFDYYFTLNDANYNLSDLKSDNGINIYNYGNNYIPRVIIQEIKMYRNMLIKS